MHTTIIIAMYNEEKYIWRCLESLCNQSYKNFDVILVDDGSKDNTVLEAEKYLMQLPLRIVHQQYWPEGKTNKTGPAAARNTWAQKATGDILVFVDADMYFDKNYISELITPIVSWEEIWTAHGIEKIGNPENIRAKARCIDRIPNPVERSGVYRAIRKDVFIQSGGYPETWGYFDDNMSHLNKWKWAKTVMSAICYHNNPTSLREIYNHSKRVGASLKHGNALTLYVKKYVSRVIGLLVIFFVFCWLLYHWYYRKELIVAGLIWFIIISEIPVLARRNNNDFDSNYLFSIPIITYTRILWYIRWIL